jgi:hypothetical protein
MIRFFHPVADDFLPAHEAKAPSLKISSYIGDSWNIPLSQSSIETNKGLKITSYSIPTSNSTSTPFLSSLQLIGRAVIINKSTSECSSDSPRALDPKRMIFSTGNCCLSFTPAATMASRSFFNSGASLKLLILSPCFLTESKSFSFSNCSIHNHLARYLQTSQGMKHWTHWTGRGTTYRFFEQP